ncbi:GTPase activating protein Gyp51 [Schizosaccharomyces pombe]
MAFTEANEREVQSSYEKENVKIIREEEAKDQESTEDIAVEDGTGTSPDLNFFSTQNVMQMNFEDEYSEFSNEDDEAEIDNSFADSIPNEPEIPDMQDEYSRDSHSQQSVEEQNNTTNTDEDASVNEFSVAADISDVNTLGKDNSESTEEPVNEVNETATLGNEDVGERSGFPSEGLDNEPESQRDLDETGNLAPEDLKDEVKSVHEFNEPNDLRQQEESYSDDDDTNVNEFEDVNEIENEHQLSVADEDQTSRLVKGKMIFVGKEDFGEEADISNSVFIEQNGPNSDTVSGFKETSSIVNSSSTTEKPGVALDSQNDTSIFNEEQTNSLTETFNDLTLDHLPENVESEPVAGKENETAKNESGASDNDHKANVHVFVLKSSEDAITLNEEKIATQDDPLEAPTPIVASSSTIFLNSNQRNDELSASGSQEPHPKDDTNSTSSLPLDTNNLSNSEPPSHVLDASSETIEVIQTIKKLQNQVPETIKDEVGKKNTAFSPGTSLSTNHVKTKSRSAHNNSTSPFSTAVSSWLNPLRYPSDKSPRVISSYLESVFISKPRSIGDAQKLEILEYLQSQSSTVSNQVFTLLSNFIQNPLFVLDECFDEFRNLILMHNSHTVHTVVWKTISSWTSYDYEMQYSSLSIKNCDSDKAIRKDLDRTFAPEILSHFFSNRQQLEPTDNIAESTANLHRVLRSLAIVLPQVGYTQGMSWIAGALLMHLPAPQAFALLVFLFKNYHLQNIFSSEMRGLSRVLHQFTRLVEDYMPSLAIHFKRQDIKTCSYASEWFLTLFAYKFPLEVVAHLYDILFLYGPGILFNFGLALLSHSQESLLKLNMDRLISYLKEDIFLAFKETQEGENYDTSLFVKTAFSFEIQPDVLDRYGNEYDILLKSEHELDSSLEEMRNRHKSLNEHFIMLSDSMANLQVEHENMSALLLKEKKYLKNQTVEQASLKSEIASLNSQLAKQKSEIEQAFQGDMEAIIAENLEIMVESQSLEDEIFRKEKQLAETKVNLAVLDEDHMMALQKWSQLMNRIKTK